MSAPKDNPLTIAAIAIVAMCMTTAAHEAVGHGGACIAAGGRVAQLTSVFFQCRPSSWLIAAAGPAGNLIWGLLAAGIAGNLRGTLRLLFTLTALFSLLWKAGYMLYAAVFNDGDYYFALRGIFGDATPLMRAILGALGAALYFISLNLGRTLLQPFATESVRMREMLRTAWLAATIAALAATLLYAPDRMGAFKQALLEIGAASAPLMLLRREYRGGGDAPATGLNVLWIAAAAAIYAGFALTLGRGISA